VCKKIAICGYSKTRLQAPIHDESWEIWTMNNSVHLFPEKSDLHFDIHNTKRYSKNHDYYKWLMKNKDKCILNGLDTRLEDFKVYPKESILKKYGNYFTCSAAWMVAYAIEQKPTDIALYGIDCAIFLEYIKQKPSLLYFLGIAKGLGINIILPDDCKLFKIDQEYWNG
jgi:hypothetical protein